MFVKSLLDLGKQDDNAERLVQIASELTIHSDWLMKARIRRDELDHETVAASVIQRAYKSKYRKHLKLQKLRKQSAVRTDLENEILQNEIDSQNISKDTTCTIH